MLSDWRLTGTSSIVPTFVGYGQLVEEVNRFPWLIDMFYDVILRIPGIVGNAACLALWC